MKDSVQRGAFPVSFVVAGNPNEESITVKVDGEDIPAEISPAGPGTFSVSALANNISSGESLIEISASSRYSDVAKRTYIYPVQIVNSGNILDINGNNEVVLFNPGVKHNLCGEREEVLNDTFHSASLTFLDIKNDPNEKYIMDLANRCIVHGEGKDKSQFHPEGVFNRAAAVKTVIRGFGYNYPPQALSAPFLDVKKEQWFAPYLEVGKKYQIIRGYSNGKFLPENSMNVAEGLAIVARASKANINDYNTGTGVWFDPYMKWGVAKGLINADEKASDMLTRGGLSRMVSLR